MRQLKNVIFFLSIFLFSYSTLNAQISRGGSPKSFRLGLNNDLVDKVSMPSVDVGALLLEDIDRAQSNLPYRFAKGFAVDYNLNNSGTWTQLDNGDRIWRLKITCKNAKSINFLYDDFFIPEGGLVYVYSEDGSIVLGAFGAHNNRPNRKFATGIVESTSVVLEYYEPAAAFDQGAISITQIGHAYRDFDGPVGMPEGLGDAGSCQVNINCSPEGDDWQTVKKSVARIIINGVETCTGTLINNIAENCTPYFLTANHCIDNTYDAITNPSISGAVFYWNYERPNCANTGSVPIETTAGATLIANSDPPNGDNSASDFALFELTEDPSDSYDVYVAGFDASGDPGENGAGIHHPGLDAKKIATHSIIPDIVVNDYFWRIYWDATANGHSVTEGGSSGSGLFNSNGNLIGQLYGGFLGGQPNCSDPANDEGDYGRLSVSWDGIPGTTLPERRLKDWLDPNDTGLTVVDGKFCTIPDYELASVPSTSTNCGANTATYTIEVIGQNGYMDVVDVDFSGLPSGATASFSVDPVVPGNNTILTISGLNNVADGSYDFLVEGNSTSGDKTILVGLDVADPSTAVLQTPSDGAVGESTLPLLTWTSDIGVESYDVEVATDAGFTNIVASGNVSTNSWIVSPALDILSTFYWRARNVRVCGNDPWSSSFTFTTADANPGTCGNPIMMSCDGTFSGNNSTGENNFEVHDVGGSSNWTGPELVFQFSAAAGDVEVTMSGLSDDLDLYLFTDCGDVPGSELDESENGGSNSETVSANVADGVYYIMVDGYLASISDFDLVLTCIPLSCDPLNSLSLFTPINGAINQSITPNLSWSNEPMAVSYDVEVATDNLFVNLVASANVTTESWTITPGLMASTTYFWRTRNVQTCGNDPWSSTFSFTTLAAEFGCPISEDFETGQPAGWSFSVSGNNAQWNFDGSTLFGPVSNPGNANWAIYDDFVTGMGGGNNIATAVSPIMDLSGYENVEMSFNFAYVEDASSSEFVTMSISDGILSYFWDGTAWLTTSTTWMSGATVMNGFFFQTIPVGLDLSNLVVTIEFDDNGSDTRAGFGFDNFAVCGDIIPTCIIQSANISNISCNDNNTPSQADDYFTFDLTPDGAGVGASYSISGNYTQSGLSYGITTTIDNGGVGFLISNGNLNISLTDDSNPSCVLSVMINAPNVCSITDPCTNTEVLSGVLNGLEDIEATWIESTQEIMSGAVVDYDVTDFISLNAGFTVNVGAVFEAFIDGCNGGSGGSN